MQRLFEKKCNKDKNRGASLLLVIVTMAFVTIIASVILVITYRNLEAMKNSRYSSQSFYSAEAAMDELKKQFYEWSDEAYCKAYTEWLASYSSYAETEREEKFRLLYRDRLEEVVNNKFMVYFGASPEDIDNLFVTFTSDRVSWNDKYSPTLVRNADDYGLTVKDVSLSYKDSDDYETTITTDISLGVRYYGLRDNAVYNIQTDCADYAIIADGQIANTLNSNVSINGSIYAGGYNWAEASFSSPGIVFDGGRAEANSDSIVSKGDIVVSNGAVLKASGYQNALNPANNSSCNIWTRGFNLSGTGASTIDVSGKCYVYDDTTLDAKTINEGSNSLFKVKGAYYGYNTSNASLQKKDENNVELRMGTPEGSSSIIVNKPGSKVDLTECSPVWISGKTFVSVPKLYGESDILDTNVSFPEGESIAYRGTQSAYLLPGECIVGIGHNPMSVEEYDRLLNDNTVRIDIDKSRQNGGVSLSGYIQTDKPYRVATVDYSSESLSGKIIYLYMNFISSDKATEYFKKYSERYEELVDAKMETLGQGSIAFNPSTLVTTGNTVLYDGTDNSTDVVENTDTIYDERIETTEAELNSRYNGLITALDENYSGLSMTEFMTDNFVNFSMIDGDKSEELDCTGSNGLKYRLITGNDITVDVNTNAIIIASGNVTVNTGATVTGIILAKGNVTLKGAKVNSDPEKVAELILNNDKVIPYFDSNAGQNETPPNNSVSTSDIVKVDYVNWRKN